MRLGHCLWLCSRGPWVYSLSSVAPRHCCETASSSTLWSSDSGHFVLKRGRPGRKKKSGSSAWSDGRKQKPSVCVRHTYSTDTELLLYLSRHDFSMTQHEDKSVSLFPTDAVQTVLQQEMHMWKVSFGKLCEGVWTREEQGVDVWAFQFSVLLMFPPFSTHRTHTFFFYTWGSNTHGWFVTFKTHTSCRQSILICTKQNVQKPWNGAWDCYINLVVCRGKKPKKNPASQQDCETASSSLWSSHRGQSVWTRGHVGIQIQKTLVVPVGQFIEEGETQTSFAAQSRTETKTTYLRYTCGVF